MSADDPKDPVDPFAGLDEDPFAAIEDEPAPELPVEQFVEELERLMLAGHSFSSIRHWAMREYSVDKDMLNQLMQMVRQTWALESQTVAQTKIRRDHLRVRYFEVFEAAMASGDFLPAVKALDSVAKLDGLTSPDVNLTQVNVNSGGAYTGQITSGVRERIAQLADTMRLRAEQRSLKAATVIDIASSLPEKKKNGSGR